MRALGRHLGASGWGPRRALTSRYTRALETAALVLTSAGVALEPEVVDELLPDGSLVAIAAALEAMLDGTAHALLVGHQPLCGELVEWWSGDSAALAPGEFVAIEFATRPGRGAGRVIDRIAPR
jgi:phosphohistidine phosphatase SixA